MSIKLKSEDTVRSLIAFINKRTEKEDTNLTDAVRALEAERERGFFLLNGTLGGTVKRLTVKDMGNITSLPQYLFSMNENLEYFEFPDTLTSIGQGCFYTCINLVSYSLPEAITDFKSSVFYKTKVAFTKLPDALETIATNVFTYCTELRISEIPAGVKSISRGAFAYCTGIKTITFKGTPDTLEGTVFTGCTELTEINVPWAEGEVAKAPWGAPNAKINYNCTV